VAVLKRAVKEFKEDNLTDWAAALTYYGVLAIFPAMLAVLSILGLLGTSSIRPLIDNLGSLAPGAARDIITSMLEQLERSQGKAGVALIIGLVVVLWSASGYIAAFMRASNAVYDIGEGRPVWKTSNAQYSGSAGPPARTMDATMDRTRTMCSFRQGNQLAPLRSSMRTA
jgi:membrane protein